MKIMMWQWYGIPVSWYTYYKNMVVCNNNIDHYMDEPTIEVEDRDTPIGEIIAEMDIRKEYVLLAFVDEKSTLEFWNALKRVERETELYPEILEAMLTATPTNWGNFSTNDTIQEVLSMFMNKIKKLVIVSGCTNEEKYACTVLCNGTYSLYVDKDTLTFIKSKIQ